MSEIGPNEGEPSDPGAADSDAPRSESPMSRWRRVLSIGASIGLVVALLVGVLPAMADFDEVWNTIQSMTWLETVSLLLAAGWNILTYQFVILVALPGITLLQAFVVGQISTAVSNTLPAGSAIGVGVTYTLFSSFGFSAGSIAIASVVTGLWNTFVKLALPVVALALLTLRGGTDAGLQSAALVGLAILAGAVVFLWLVMSIERVARRAGARLGGIATRLARPFRRGPYDGWGTGLARFRAQSIDLVRRRWHVVTLATLISHLSLFALLLLCLRHMGVAADDVTWTEALAAFALVRLATAIPITPGNLGIVEVGLTAALVVAGGDRSLVVAAVLVYRALSYLLQVPLGLVSYVIWRSKASWRVPAHPGAGADPPSPTR